jgi:hypothetical protein
MSNGSLVMTISPNRWDMTYHMGGSNMPSATLVIYILYVSPHLHGDQFLVLPLATVIGKDHVSATVVR